MVPTEEEHELRQFAVEFKKFPVPEKVIQESLKQLSSAILQEMHEKGLIKY